jgi:hypothetical protein
MSLAVRDRSFDGSGQQQEQRTEDSCGRTIWVDDLKNNK